MPNPTTARFHLEILDIETFAAFVALIRGNLVPPDALRALTNTLNQEAGSLQQAVNAEQGQTSS